MNYNGKRILGDLLDKAVSSALNQTYANKEVLFIDNGSTDDSVIHIKKRYEKLKIINFEKNLGFCKANNLAAFESSGEILLFMNSDVILSENYVEKLVQYMARDENIGAIQGLELSYTPLLGGSMDSTFCRPFTIHFNPGFCLELLWVAFTACLIRKDLFVNLNGLSEEFFMYHNDVDFCFRLVIKGYKCISCPYVTYFHKRGGTADNFSSLRQYLCMRNRLLIAIRYLPFRFIVRSFIGWLLESLFDVMEKNTASFFIACNYKIIKYIFKNLRKELKIRVYYSSNNKRILKFFIKTPIKLSNLESNKFLSKFIKNYKYCFNGGDLGDCR